MTESSEALSPTIKAMWQRRNPAAGLELRQNREKTSRPINPHVLKIEHVAIMSSKLQQLGENHKRVTYVRLSKQAYESEEMERKF
jgi:hypothetical protein